MRKILLTSAVGIAGLAISAMSAAPALADDGDTSGGISTPGTIPVETAADTAQAIAKNELAQKEYAAYLGGDATAARAAAKAYVANYGAEALGPDGQATLDASLAGTGALTGVSAAAISTPAKTLGVSQYDQNTSSYCGPAAAEALLKYLHPGASAYNGATLTQAHLAASTYLQTDASGGTPWADGRVALTLNRWTGHSYYINTASPSASYFETDVWADIYSSQPLMTDNVEIAGSYHYNNHPSNKTIGHWTTVYGYTANVASSKFTDSSHSTHVSWGDLPAEKFTYDTTNFASRFLQNNGIVW